MVSVLAIKPKISGFNPDMFPQRKNGYVYWNLLCQNWHFYSEIQTNHTIRSYKVEMAGKQIWFLGLVT
jgi:hypothetical protein